MFLLEITEKLILVAFGFDLKHGVYTFLLMLRRHLGLGLFMHRFLMHTRLLHYLHLLLLHLNLLCFFLL